MTTVGGGYDYVLRVGQGQGQRIEGIASVFGTITVSKREPSVNTCPICLVEGTLIATPAGQIPVEKLIKGDIVWTMDATGNRIAAEIVATKSTPVPVFFRAVRIELNDGRTVTASPWHPTADGRVMSDYRVGDILDGAKVVRTDEIAYEGGKTYDILPAGSTGFYWANGILLGSTLK